MTIIVGVDPGIAGAIAFLDTYDGLIEVFDLPIIKTQKGHKGARIKRRLDSSELFYICQAYNIEVAWIEQVYSSPQMGVVSAFSFGENFGSITAVMSLAAKRVETVTPSIWKPRLQVPANKKQSIERACYLFKGGQEAFYGPKGGLLDGRAEACLIAFYGSLEDEIVANRKLKVISNGRRSVLSPRLCSKVP